MRSARARALRAVTVPRSWASSRLSRPAATSSPRPGSVSSVSGVGDAAAAFVDAVVGCVGVQHLRVAVSQAAAGLGFPGVAEPPQGGQFCGLGAAGQEPERGAGFDGGELVVVADQEQLGSRGAGLAGEGIQGGGGGERGLIDDHQLPRPQWPTPVGQWFGLGVAGVVQPFGGVLAADAEGGGEHLGSGRGRCEPDHAAVAVGVLPGLGHPVQQGGLARPGWTDQHLHPAPRACRHHQGSRLIAPQPLRIMRAEAGGGCGQVCGSGQESVLGVQDCLAGPPGPRQSTAVQCGRVVQADAERLSGLGEGIQGTEAVGGGGEPVRLEGAGCFSGEVPRRPGRAPHSDAVHDGRGEVVERQGPWQGQWQRGWQGRRPVEGGLDGVRAGVSADLLGAAGPLRPQLRQRRDGLVGPGGQGGLLPEFDHLDPVGAAAVGGLERGEQADQGGVDRGAP